MLHAINKRKRLMSPEPSLFNNLLKHLDAGYWRIDSQNNAIEWSDEFCELIEFEPISHPTVHFFVENLLHQNSKENFLLAFNNYINDKQDIKLDIQMMNIHGNYNFYECSTNDSLPNFLLFRNIDNRKEILDKYNAKNYYYKETAEMSATGGWYIDFIRLKTIWDSETRNLLGYDHTYEPSVKNFTEYFADSHINKVASIFSLSGENGAPFDEEVIMKSATERKFWVRVKGKAVFNDLGKIVGIRGVIQDIDKTKMKAVSLQRSLDIIASQNKRLLNFAHIVSHNLRSHSSNLQLITEMIGDIEDIDEKLLLVDNIKDVSENLNTTIEHLNEVVTIRTKVAQNRVEVDLEATLGRVTKSIEKILIKEETTIQTDFTEFKSIKYIPAYIESIFLNLITNAVKYKHYDRKPQIKIKTFMLNGYKFMDFIDNGVGIDLNLYGDKIFGMYKTFHRNPDAVGIGLFMTKNQIESLNGSIEVFSEIDKGTTFRIQF